MLEATWFIVLLLMTVCLAVSIFLTNFFTHNAISNDISKEISTEVSSEISSEIYREISTEISSEISTGASAETIQEECLVQLLVPETVSDNENEESERHKLPASFIAMCGRLGFIVHDVPKDGNCMFAAVADQLLRVTRHEPYSVSTLRDSAVNYLRRHPYSTQTNTHLSEFVGNETWDEYLARMSRNQEWGDHLMLTALSEWLQTRIQIYHDNAFHPTVVEPQAYISANPRRPHYRRTLTLGLIENCHYVSMEAKQSSETTEPDDIPDTSDETDDSASETEEGFQVVPRTTTNIIVGDGGTQGIGSPRIYGHGRHTIFNMAVGTNCQQILYLTVHCLIPETVVAAIKDIVGQTEKYGTMIVIKLEPLGLNSEEETKYADAERQTIKILNEDNNEKREELHRNMIKLGGKLLTVDAGCIELTILPTSRSRLARFVQKFYAGMFEVPIQTIFSCMGESVDHELMLRVTVDIKKQTGLSQNVKYMNNPKCNDSHNEGQVLKDGTSGIRACIIPTFDSNGSHERLSDPFVLKALAKELILCASQGTPLERTGQQEFGVAISTEVDARRGGAVPQQMEVPSNILSQQVRAESTELSEDEELIALKLELARGEEANQRVRLVPEKFNKICDQLSLNEVERMKKEGTGSSLNTSEREGGRCDPTWRLNIPQRTTPIDDEHSHETAVQHFSSMQDMRQRRTMRAPRVLRRLRPMIFGTRLNDLTLLTKEVSRNVGRLLEGKTPRGNVLRIGNNYLLTCYHVVKCIQNQSRKTDHMEDMEIGLFFDGKTTVIGATMKFKSEFLDVALLEITSSEAEPRLPDQLSLISITHVFPGDVFYLIGHPSGTKNSEVERAVFRNTLGHDVPFDTRDNVIFETKSFHHGSSGSPCLVLKHNKLYVGAMLVGGYKDETGTGTGNRGIIHYGVRMSSVYDCIMGENPELGDMVFAPWTLEPAEQEFKENLARIEYRRQMRRSAHF